jgi:hypothetical protein
MEEIQQTRAVKEKRLRLNDLHWRLSDDVDGRVITMPIELAPSENNMWAKIGPVSSERRQLHALQLATGRSAAPA